MRLFAKEYTESEGFEKELNYDTFLCDNPTVIQQRDLSFLRAWDLHGPDLRYASDAERERLSALVSQAFRLCAEDGWFLHIHDYSRDRPGYLPSGAFPDATSALIDEERRRRYEADGTHYEHVMALAITWKPPREWQEKVSHYFYEGMEQGQEGRQGLLREFIRVTEEVTDVLSSVLILMPMDRDGLTTYLHTCVTGDDHEMHAPDTQIPLNYAIANQEVWGGNEPWVAEQHVRIIGIDNFPPASEPQGQEFLQDLGIPFHSATRFVFYDHEVAKAKLNQKRRKHYQRRAGIRGVWSETLQGDAGHGINQGALALANDARDAMAELEIGDAIYGTYTRTVTVWHEQHAMVEEYAKRVQQAVRQKGYGARLETVNTMDAFVGSLPGHGVQNLRGVLLHTLNLADLLPVTSTWSGQQTITNPHFPRNSPALMLCTTHGKAPFYVSPYYGDVGHKMVLGPSGSGKTTLLNMDVAQYMRYPKARVFALDNKYGMYVLCRAMDGWHYDIGGTEGVGCMPLARVEDEDERVWAAWWLEECLLLQGVHVTPGQRRAIWEALVKMGTMPHNRTMTDFCATVQDEVITDGLHHYTLSGGGGDLFDCSTTPPLNHRFVVCELSHLIQRGDKDLIPAMLYYIHEIERQLDGTPTCIPIDEGWMPLMHSRLGDKLEQWLRLFRDKNAMLIFASQSVADVNRSTHRDIFIDQCPTKILSPNPEAENPSNQALYQAIGLSDQEIAALRWAMPKRDYLYHSPLGRSLYTMGLERGALSFVGVSGPENVRAIKECADTYGEVWPYHHLLARGCKEEAAWWLADHERRQGKEKPYATLFPVPTPAQRNGAVLTALQ